MIPKFCLAPFLALPLLLVCAVELKASAASLQLRLHAQPLSVSKDFAGMVSRMREARGKFDMMPRPEQAQVECAQFNEIAQTYVCIFNYKLFMNAALGRVAFFVEEKEAVRNHQEHLAAVANDRTEGHNFISSDVKKYNDRLLKEARTFAPPTSPLSAVDKGFLLIEDEFREQFLIPKIIPSRNVVLIALAADTDTKTNFSHEIMHAQYFHSAEMQKSVHTFWQNKVSRKDRELIRKKLSSQYNVANTLLVENEFQAYLLMTSPEKSLLKDFVKKYRNPLRNHMAKTGMKPLADQILP